MKSDGPFVDPQIEPQLAASPTHQCAVIVTCADGAAADPPPPIPEAKLIAGFPGMFAAVIDQTALEKLRESGQVAAIELDSEAQMLG